MVIANLPEMQLDEMLLRVMRLRPVALAFIPVNARHRKTLRATFALPTSPSVAYSDIEALVVALGDSVTDREGSRVKIALQGEHWHCHRPHPGKEAMRYQVEEARELFEGIGVKP